MRAREYGRKGGTARWAKNKTPVMDSIPTPVMDSIPQNAQMGGLDATFPVVIIAISRVEGPTLAEGPDTWFFSGQGRLLYKCLPGSASPSPSPCSRSLAWPDAAPRGRSLRFRPPIPLSAHRSNNASVVSQRPTATSSCALRGGPRGSAHRAALGPPFCCAGCDTGHGATRGVLLNHFYDSGRLCLADLTLIICYLSSII
jgi:hypothetical protein